MKRVLLLVLIIGCIYFAAAESPWQYGRIDSVKRSVTTSTKVWVANTPLEEERTQYTISVHVQDRIIVGVYDVIAYCDPNRRRNGFPATRYNWRSDADFCICGR